MLSETEVWRHKEGFKHCGLHEVGTSARQTSLPRCKSQQPQFRQNLLLHSQGKLARVNFKECPKPLLVCQSCASSMSLVSSELVRGCPGGCRRRRGAPARGQSWVRVDSTTRHKSGYIRRRVGWLLAAPPVKPICKILALQPVWWKSLSR